MFKRNAKNYNNFIMGSIMLISFFSNMAAAGCSAGDQRGGSEHSSEAGDTSDA